MTLFSAGSSFRALVKMSGVLEGVVNNSELWRGPGTKCEWYRPGGPADYVVWKRCVTVRACKDTRAVSKYSD